MGEPESRTGGLVASVRRITDSVFAILLGRFELAALELQEEKIRLLDLLLHTAVAVVLGIMSLVSATALVIVVFWDKSPVLTLSLITAVYVLGAGVSWWKLRSRVKNGMPPLADTLAEFKKDREWLQGKQ
jgi:uncharacterized membrane protein YqjE